MGGCAFLIHGSLIAGVAPSASDRPSLFGRLFGKSTRTHVAVASVPAQATQEIPVGDLGKKLRNSFRKFFKNRFREPWAATKTIFSYIDMSHNTYVRADGANNGQLPKWYVQINFSGCSGMAEVSAELASHWASIWFAEQRDEIIRASLAPFGFEANSEKDKWIEDLRFLPIGNLGYAQFLSPAKVAELKNQASRFEIDCSIRETFSESDLESFLGDLDSKYATLFNDGKCRCQLCSPDLDEEQIARLLSKYLR